MMMMMVMMMMMMMMRHPDIAGDVDHVEAGCMSCDSVLHFLFPEVAVATAAYVPWFTANILPLMFQDWQKPVS